MRPLADRPRKKTKFLILGSASPDLVRGTERIPRGTGGVRGSLRFRSPMKQDLRLGNDSGSAAVSLAPISHPAAKASLQWRSDFARTFLERDIPQLGSRVPAEALRRFWMMLAHYHGQIWNGAELARGMGVSEHTVRGYLDLLSACYLVRQIQPWFENISKRQFKAPKVYIRDSGLLHALLSLGSHEELQGHPKRGASWEGFGIEQVLGFLGGHDAYYWGTHAWGGTRSASHPARQTLRVRVQMHRRPVNDQIAAYCLVRPAPRSGVDHLSWNGSIRCGRKGRGHPPHALARQTGLLGVATDPLDTVTSQVEKNGPLEPPHPARWKSSPAGSASRFTTTVCSSSSSPSSSLRIGLPCSSSRSSAR